MSSACSLTVTRLHGVSVTVILEPWGSGDLTLLERLMGDPRMTEHLGGPESPDKLRERQSRYERLEGGDRLFRIVDVESGAGVGSVGFWTKEWRDPEVYEIGWMVVPEFQGRGIAMAATAQAIELAKGDDRHRFMHAFRTSTTRRRTRSAASSASNCSRPASSSSRRATS
jgi:RimJ/RimL family protein N-acetyltransferase